MVWKCLLSCTKLQTLLALLNWFNNCPLHLQLQGDILLSPCLIVRYDHIHLNFCIQFTARRAALCSVSWALLLYMIHDWSCCSISQAILPVLRSWCGHAMVSIMVTIMLTGLNSSSALAEISSRATAKPLFPFLTVEGVLFLWVCLCNCLIGTERWQVS